MIRLESVSVRHAQGGAALENVSVEFPCAATSVLVGASGAGKSTLLRLVNRLVEPSRGRVLINGQDTRLRDPVALRREIGYSVQGGGLLPRLNVAENAAIVPGLLGWPPEKIRASVERALEMVHLDPASFASRMPASLSGGERQRASIARALAAGPKLLLLDEPLGALDPHLSETLQDELRELFVRLDMTVLLVTHDMHLAVRMASRIAVLDGGRLLQFGTPREVVSAPAGPAVEALLGRRRADLIRALEEAA